MLTKRGSFVMAGKTEKVEVIEKQIERYIADNYEEL
jgi:hypothetical protein